MLFIEALSRRRRKSERLFGSNGGSILDSSNMRSNDARSLETAQTLLAALFDSAPMAIAIFSVAGVHDMANASAAAYYGMTVEEMLASDELSLSKFWPNFSTDVRPAIQDVVKTKSVRVIRTVFQRPGSCGLTNFEVTFFPILDAGGHIKQIGNFARDLTEQMRVESELEARQSELHQSEKLSSLGLLLAGVSHELNNPLAAVIGQTAMLAEDVGGTLHLARVEKIRRAAERCAKIVQSFLAMARQQTPEFEIVQLNDLVRSALDLTGFQMKFNRIEIEANLDPQLPFIAADPDQLHQVIVNLLNNACQAVEEQLDRRKILIVSTMLDSQIRLTVADSGTGVSAQDKPRIFDPFFTTKTAGAGTGLGLPFSLGIVEAHGGTITLDDVPGGASFSIILPIGDQQVAKIAELESDQTDLSSRGKVLVIDDEEELAETIADMLRRMGLDVAVAFGGTPAIQQLSAGANFDMILSDVRMPDVDGLALHAWISRERPELLPRLAFITGDTLSGTASDFLAKCGRPFLEKPFMPSALRELVAIMIER